jgi:hypothetical protein
MTKHEFRYMQHLHLFIYKLFSRGDKIQVRVPGLKNVNHITLTKKYRFF